MAEQPAAASGFLCESVLRLLDPASGLLTQFESAGIASRDEIVIRKHSVRQI